MIFSENRYPLFGIMLGNVQAPRQWETLRKKRGFFNAVEKICLGLGRVVNRERAGNGRFLLPFPASRVAGRGWGALPLARSTRLRASPQIRSKRRPPPLASAASLPRSTLPPTGGRIAARPGQTTITSASGVAA